MLLAQKESSILSPELVGLARFWNVEWSKIRWSSASTIHLLFCVCVCVRHNNETPMKMLATCTTTFNSTLLGYSKCLMDASRRCQAIWERKSRSKPLTARTMTFKIVCCQNRRQFEHITMYKREEDRWIIGRKGNVFVSVGLIEKMSYEFWQAAKGICACFCFFGL